MIDGVRQKALKKIGDERGSIMHMMRSSDPDFEGFGEVYFSWVNPGVVKGWHKHSVVSVNLAVPVGAVKIVVFDDRDGSETKGQTQEFVIGGENYSLLSISPGLWYGFACVGDAAAMIANCATHPHDPDESAGRDLADVDYDWGIE